MLVECVHRGFITSFADIPQVDSRLSSGSPDFAG
jgi:hypothetical protein